MVIARAADEKINVGFPSEMERRGLALGSFGARNIARRQKRAPRKSNLTLKVPGWSGSDGRIPREKGEKPVRRLRVVVDLARGNTRASPRVDLLRVIGALDASAFTAK